MSASLLTLAWKSLANRGVSVALTILSIVLAVMLFLGVEKIRTGVRASSATSLVTMTSSSMNMSEVLLTNAGMCGR